MFDPNSTFEYEVRDGFKLNCKYQTAGFWLKFGDDYDAATALPQVRFIRTLEELLSRCTSDSFMDRITQVELVEACQSMPYRAMLGELDKKKCESRSRLNIANSAETAPGENVGSNNPSFSA